MGLGDEGITLHCNSDFKTKQLKYRKLIWPWKNVLIVCLSINCPLAPDAPLRASLWHEPDPVVISPVPWCFVTQRERSLLLPLCSMLFLFLKCLSACGMPWGIHSREVRSTLHSCPVVASQHASEPRSVHTTQHTSYTLSLFNDSDS